MSARAFVSLTEADAARIIAGLDAADIYCHASPDGDTIGCAAALYYIMRANGADAEIKCCDPVPEYLLFLTDGVKIDDKPRQGVCKISVDVASASQLGAFAAGRDSFLMMIDHHERGELFADGLVEGDAAACGEIIFRVAEILRDCHGYRIPVEAVDAIYAAISSDTGSFRFANTTSATHMTAARLHELGAHTVYIAHNLHAVKMKKQMLARRVGLEHMKFFCGGKLALTYASLDDMKNGGFEPSDFSEADEMRSIYGVYVGVALRETKTGEWRASTRANVDIDCAEVCAGFGGGGHRGAAGCSVFAADADEAAAIIAEAFERAIFKYDGGGR